MTKHQSITYKPRWDYSTWSLIGLVAFFSLLPLIFDDDGIVPIIVGGVMLVFVVITFASVSYRIEGTQLIVYTFFRPHVYPIDNISGISQIKTYLSAPATSLTHRIAITFTDKKNLRSTTPLIISPADQTSFIAHLLSINPNIDCDLRA